MGRIIRQKFIKFGKSLVWGRKTVDNKQSSKDGFFENLQKTVGSLNSYTSTINGDWTIKGFIDTYKNIYTISSDTKIISKILEIHIFPKLLEFSEKYGYLIILADYQNYYPDLTFIKKEDKTIKFAVDIKSTYRIDENPIYCNGFTLGSHGEYFQNRSSNKNIQFPYKEYIGHYCIGIIYTRASHANIDETKITNLCQLSSITSVIKDLHFFVAEKWKIASDNQGSSNTANIGSIVNISDLESGNGVFSKLGEEWFDDYWMNYGKITFTDNKGKTKKITRLIDFVNYRKGDTSLIVKKDGKKKVGHIED